jgi:hypothetical protein
MSASNPDLSRRLRSLLAALALGCLAVSTVSAADISFVRVWPRWRTTDFFMRISEYFGAPEDPGGRILLRTHPGDRTGCYFLARVRNRGAAESGARFVLSVITPDKPEPRVYVFSSDIPAGEPVFEIGLTGADWPARKVRPVAWQLELRAADGAVLATSKSFLWSK